MDWAGGRGSFCDRKLARHATGNRFASQIARRRRGVSGSAAHFFGYVATREAKWALRRTRLASAVLLALLTAAAPLARAGPMFATRVDVNGSRHLDNHVNVGIYQWVGDQVEQPASRTGGVAVQTTLPGPYAQRCPSAGMVNAQWPTTSLSSTRGQAHHGDHDHGHGFSAPPEAGCRTDHLADVQSTFWWAIPDAAGPVKH